MVFRSFKNYGLLLWALFLTGYSDAVEAYTPNSQSVLSEKWRWTELEALGNGGFVDAVEGLSGNIWFLSQLEAVRFDGAEAKKYALPDCDWVRQILIDSEGRVFVITSLGCLSLTQEGWGTFIAPNSQIGLVTAGYVDEGGSIWFGGSRGFCKVQGMDTFVWAADLLAVNSMVVESDGSIWASELDGNSVYLLREDTSNNRLKIEKRIEVPNASGGITLDSDSGGRVWCHARDGKGNIYRVDRGTLEIVINGSRNTIVFKMAELESDWLVFVGPRVLVESKGGMNNYFTSDDYNVPTADSFVLALSNGKLLVGDSESRPVLIDLSDQRWMSFQGLNYQCESPDGTWWFLEHEGGVVAYDPLAETWLRYGVEDGVVERPNRVFSSEDGTIWASGAHGEVSAVSRFVKNRWILDVFAHAGEIFSHLGVVQSEDGSVLFGSGSPSWKLGKKTGGVVIYRMRDHYWEGELKAPPLYPSRGAVLAFQEGKGIWIGGDALWLKPKIGDLETSPIQLAREGHWIDHALVDSKNRLWVAAWGLGVHRFGEQDNLLLNEENGLSSNQVIYLLESKDGAGVWALHSEGLSRWDGYTWSNWELPFGMPLRRESNTLRRDSSGSVWLNYGYRSWLMTGELDESKSSQYQTIRYRNTGHAPDTKIVRSDTNLVEGSSVLVEWSGLDQWSETSSKDLEYSWRVGDSAWSAYSKRNNVVLTGLGNGLNRFEVRARDHDWNVDMSPAVASLRIVPVIWKRAWFIIAVVATLGLILFLVLRLFKMRVQAALEVEEFKLDFFTNISHELKNPLAVIVGPLESSLEHTLPSAIKFRLEMALKNARKMQGLIQELLQFRKMERGKATYRPSSGEVIGFIRDSIEMLEPLWREKEQTLEFESNEPYYVCGYDADKLQKIVDNLLSNAIKHCGRNADIRAKVDIFQDGDRRMLCFYVEDDGPGISIEDQQRVLQPFVRTRESRENSEGLGLGLALTNELLRVCGGELTLNSPINEKGRGTRASVILPLSSSLLENSSIEALAEEEDFAEGGAAESSAKAKVLLVEDSDDLRVFMKEELSDHYEIFEAANGRVGLEVAAKASPDLIVTDVMMPEMDGFELCRRLRAGVETSHIPIVLLTAKSSEEDQLEGVEAGADVFFAKPLNMRRLAAQIENLIELRREMRKGFAEKLVIEPRELTVVSADQEFLCKAIEIVEARLDDGEFDVEAFAKYMAMGRTTFYKKLKALTGTPPNAFIRSMRLKRAAQLLQTGDHTVSEVLEYVAIYDLSHFSRIFKKEFGMSPTAYIAEHTKRG